MTDKVVSVAQAEESAFYVAAVISTPWGDVDVTPAGQERGTGRRYYAWKRAEDDGWRRVVGPFTTGRELVDAVLAIAAARVESGTG